MSMLVVISNCVQRGAATNSIVYLIVIHYKGKLARIALLWQP